MTIEKWVIDADHSLVEFSVKHMMIAKVRGNFENFDANITADSSDLTTAAIEFTIDTASIHTKNEDRDNHLRAADFFDVESYPNITFKATEITKVSGDDYKVSGDVTIKDITRPETFEVTFEGEGKDPWGNTKAGFSAKTKINRSDYGLTYNAALETGGVLIGDQITINIELEASKG
ncbi:YceI family protein [Peribacillus sp. FSL H8-0477]|uniref:YceI family protein n=1 Tax=Peribacillus sp. FSL H8-0477 TaxID=2921388 RepID=UPI0030FB0EF6